MRKTSSSPFFSFNKNGLERKHDIREITLLFPRLLALGIHYSYILAYYMQGLVFWFDSPQMPRLIVQVYLSLSTPHFGP